MPWLPSTNPAIVERWRRRVTAQAASGLTVRVFAQQRGIGADSLYRWRTWFRQQREAAPQLPALVEVMVVELTSGRRLRLEPGFDANAVGRLVTVLERA